MVSQDANQDVPTWLKSMATAGGSQFGGNAGGGGRRKEEGISRDFRGGQAGFSGGGEGACCTEQSPLHFFLLYLLSLRAPQRPLADSLRSA